MLKYITLALLITVSLCAGQKVSIDKQTYQLLTSTVSKGDNHIISGDFGFTYNVKDKKIPTYNFIPNINSKDTAFILGESKADDKIQNKVKECSKDNYCYIVPDNKAEAQILGADAQYSQAITVAPLTSATSYTHAGEVPTADNGFSVSYLPSEGADIVSNQLGLSPTSPYLAWLGKTYAFTGAADGDVMFKICINGGKPLSA